MPKQQDASNARSGTLDTRRKLVGLRQKIKHEPVNSASRGRHNKSASTILPRSETDPRALSFLDVPQGRGRVQVLGREKGRNHLARGPPLRTLPHRGRVLVPGRDDHLRVVRPVVVIAPLLREELVHGVPVVEDDHRAAAYFEGVHRAVLLRPGLQSRTTPRVTKNAR